MVVDIMIAHCVMNRPSGNRGQEVYSKLFKHMAMGFEMYLREKKLEWSLVRAEDLAYSSIVHTIGTNAMNVPPSIWV